jgi:cysteine desulfurase
MIELRDYFIDALEHNFSAKITGHRTHRLANNVHVILPNIDNERVLFALDDMGVDVATGSACSASSDEPSHVLLAIGKSDKEARSSLRFSMGNSTTKVSIDKTIALLSKAIKA